MKKLLSTLLFILLLSLQSQSQAIFSSPAYLACPATPNFQVPLLTSNISNITALNLHLYYDGTSLQYNGYQNVNPLLNGMTIFYNNVIGFPFNYVSISGYMLTGTVTIPDSSILIEIKFTYLTDSSLLLLDQGTAQTASSMVVTGNPSIIQQPFDLTVLYGDTAKLTVVPDNILISQFQWQVSLNGGLTWNNLTNGFPYTGTTSGTLNIYPVTSAINNTKYRCRVSQCTDIYSDTVTLTVTTPIVLAGSLFYHNSLNSPLTGTFVHLKQSGAIVYSTVTSATGLYLFSNVTPGIYDIEIDCLKPWGGGNALDALMVLQHFVGMITLNGLPLQAADVNEDGNITSIDALLILQRFVGSVTSFPAGDWQRDQNSVTIPATGFIILDINAICTGDVSGSYIP